MVKIKTKKQFTLPQLIEWAMENNIKDTVFLTKAYSVGFDIHGFIYFNSSTTIPLDTMFTVEVEEEVTEDTVIPKMLEMSFDAYQNIVLDIQVNQSINTVKENAEVLTLHIINDDDTHTLIWRDGKLI